jgi:hypothetical protein
VLQRLSPAAPFHVIVAANNNEGKNSPTPISKDKKEIVNFFIVIIIKINFIDSSIELDYQTRGKKQLPLFLIACNDILIIYFNPSKMP